MFLFGFWAAPDISWLQWLLVAGVGFSLYGPQMLIGLCGAEAVAKESVSACQGFLGVISYAGASAPLRQEYSTPARLSLVVPTVASHCCAGSMAWS